MSISMVYTTFENDLKEYLKGKLPDLPVHIAQEIGAHITNKTMILVSDMMREYDRELRLRMNKSSLRHRTTQSMEEKTDG